MNSIHTKLVLSALGVALLATPAFAQRPHRQPAHQQVQTTTTTYPNRVESFTYPNGATRSGSAESIESGADFNLLAH
jgi:hypothetical protein